MVEPLPRNAVLRVVPPAQLDQALQYQAEQNAALQDEAARGAKPELSGLVGYILGQFEMFKRHRSDAGRGWNNRLVNAMRAFNGEYDPVKLSEIKKFGGSEVYARIIAMKCRGASALLRDVYLAPERSWAIQPPADPDVPPEIIEKIKQLITIELQALVQSGAMPDAYAIRDRTNQLMEAARVAEKGQAAKRAVRAQDKIEEILQTGNFYKALAEFLVNLPLFPFACIKGPVVRIVPTVSWKGGQVQVENKPRLFWNHVSPFDLWWTPGAGDIEDANVIERVRLSRADLNDLLDLDGYNTEAVRTVLDEYGSGGLNDNWDETDNDRAVYENRENPTYNQSGLINCLEFHGNVQGRMLLEYGMDPNEVPDPLRDYFVQAWVIGRWVIKVQLSPSPRKRHPYFITSFEKVPGTPVGNGLPDILYDIQEVANATLRALVNNMSISSGPQVDVNVERLAPGENPDELYPWKRWRTMSDPMGNNSDPAVKFFQPNSNTQELLTAYAQFLNIADDLSAIPKYQTGSGASGGAGRTAAGLAMLMGNASKLLQTVAANIDRDVFDPLLNALFDMLMLTDTEGVLTGDESIRVMGVNVAVQRETQRSRQLEFLQITANPIDAQIVGTKGRAAILRAVSQTIGLDGEEIVPTEEKLAEVQAQMDAQRQAEAGGQAQGSQPTPSSTNDVGPRVTVGGGVG